MEQKLNFPPRTISGIFRLHLLCSGFLNQFGWTFFGFSMIHVWVFAFTPNVREILFFIAIFPIVGLILIYQGMKKGSKAIYLMKNGYQGKGTFVRKEATNMRINKRMVFKMIYSFQDDLGHTHETETRTHFPDNLQQHENVLYDPLNPSFAIVLDDSKKSIRINEMGDLELNMPRGLLPLILPFLSITIHGTVFLFVFLLTR